LFHFVLILFVWILFNGILIKSDLFVLRDLMLHFKNSRYSDNSTQDICGYKASSIFSCSFYLIRILLFFGRVLVYNTMKFMNLKCITIMTGDKMSVINLLFNLCVKLTGSIFCVLNKLPYPANLCIWIKIKTFDLLIELLNHKLLPG
jgi:hypothetical protein